jgi:UDP-3-O-[3-hydroxymyristoyl] glucosamine N-acyltransferase
MFCGRTLTAGSIASNLGLNVVGIADISVVSPDPVKDASTGSVTWVKALSPDMRRVLERLSGALVVLSLPHNATERKFVNLLASRNALLVVGEPRLVMARILARYFSHLEVQFPRGIDPLARVDPSARIGIDVTVGPFCFIGKDVVIGDRTVLHPSVVIHSGTIIGRNSVIKSNSVIGGQGFGFVQTDTGLLEPFPQVGQVIVEDNVNVGSCTTVDRPGLGITRLLCGTKIDNLCHIGHNAQIGPHAVVTACTEVGAGVIVGEGAWLGPNSCSIDGVNIGSRSLVGIGSTVLHDVPPGAIVAGSPAEPIEILRRRKKQGYRAKYRPKAHSYRNIAHK